MRDASVDLPTADARARIVLVGHMGAGKTTLAREWTSGAGGRPTLWFDSDRAVLEALGAASAAEVFDRRGEQVWRDAEREQISARAGRLTRGAEVWSLGGGALQDPEVQRSVLDADAVVWLDAPIDVLWDRTTGGGDRPLATDRAAFVARYAERLPTWESLATVRVDTSGDSGVVELVRALSGHVSVEALLSSIVVGRGAAGRVAELSALGEDGAVCIVADQSVSAVAHAIAGRLGERRVRCVTDVPTGEWNKQLSTVESLVRTWSAAGVNRATTVIAVGGGTLLDVVGFAASIYQRGLRWVSVPTTVLAQVDAGIGGKTGANLGPIKNALGTVHHPEAVVIDPDLLATLPLRLVADGWVEAGKTALLAGGELVRSASAAAAAASTGEPVWLELIAECAAYKEAVVAEDPLDTDGVRAQLNLGHTLGHAIEAATGGAVSHGRAVAVGIAAALELSAREADLPREVVDGWRAACATLDVPVTSPLAWDELVPFLRHDKKQAAGGLGWVLLGGVGQPLTEARMDIELVREVWEQVIFESRSSTPAPATEVGRARVLVLFGVNLGELGRRDADHYGTDTLAQLVARIETWAEELGIVADCRQTDSLERFVAALHEARDASSAVIVNPGAWTHYERAIHDALEPLPLPRVEVHLSDITAREPWRAESVITPAVDHVISGHGADGYREALEWVAARIDPGALKR
jgi:shikimate kinase/3-dehydroquinate synthase